MLLSVATDQLRHALAISRNVDGGWAYHASKRSRLEPTCWALLALAQAEDRAPETNVLMSWGRQGDVLHDVPGTPINIAFNAIAALTLQLTTPASPLAAGIFHRVVASKGITGPNQPELRQDNGLDAWPWVDDTFSWVEPTAWCLLALKHAVAHGPLSGASARMAIGERMLVDRACRGGGWNYGNSNVYGRELAAYVPTTALALLALQDRPGERVVHEGLEWLQHNVLTEGSAVALSLSIICLRAHARSTTTIEKRLTELLEGRQVLGENDLLGTAMALYALTDRPMAAFALNTRNGA